MLVGNVDPNEYQEFTVKIRDRQEDAVYTVHEWALSQNEANSKALSELRELLGHDQLEVI